MSKFFERFLVALVAVAVFIGLQAIFASDANAAPEQTTVIQVIPDDEAPPTTNATLRTRHSTCSYTASGKTSTMFVDLYFTISNGYETLYKIVIGSTYGYGSYADVKFAGESNRVSTLGKAQKVNWTTPGWGSSDERWTVEMGFSNPGFDKKCTARGTA